MNDLERREGVLVVGLTVQELRQGLGSAGLSGYQLFEFEMNWREVEVTPETSPDWAPKEEFVEYLVANGKSLSAARMMATRIYNGLARQSDDWHYHTDEDEYLNLEKIEQEIFAEESPTRVSYITGVESRQQLEGFIKVRRDALQDRDS